MGTIANVEPSGNTCQWTLQLENSYGASAEYSHDMTNLSMQRSEAEAVNAASLKAWAIFDDRV